MKRNPLNRSLAEGVRQVGFRKWYERELLSGHAHLILLVLATVGLLASFEAFRGGSVAERVLDVVFIVVSALIGLWALRRYLFLLMRAETIANQANCPQCSEYGRFQVLAQEAGGMSIQVQCRRCAHCWHICS